VVDHCHCHCIGKNRKNKIKIANSSFENVSQLKYLGTTDTNKNFIQEEIKRGLNTGNACYYSVQNLLSSRLLSKNVKIRIYKTIILPPYRTTGKIIALKHVITGSSFCFVLIS
jgi:hypothetical protein